jgi:hypothetical protein
LAVGLASRWAVATARRNAAERHCPPKQHKCGNGCPGDPAASLFLHRFSSSGLFLAEVSLRRRQNWFHGEFHIFGYPESNFRPQFTLAFWVVYLLLKESSRP